MKTLRVFFVINHRVEQDVLDYLDEGQREKPLGSRMVVINALREKGPLCPSDISPKGENHAVGGPCALGR